MASLFKLISLLFLGALISSSVPCHAKTCSGYTFSGQRSFSSCTDLQHLGAALYYNHDASENAVSVAFKAPQSSGGWVAWGLNPNGTKMVGTQAVVAFHHSNGSLVAYPTRIESYAPSMEPQPLSFPVTDVSAEYVEKEMIIFATLRLAGDATKFNQVWQEGSTLSHDVPQAHSMAGDNIKSSSASTASSSLLRIKYIFRKMSFIISITHERSPLFVGRGPGKNRSTS